ncbi:MAG: hypothetical protein RL014_1103 [Pseudomonadota bacterium]|jgi:uncharacterized membrane protein YqjE
MSAPAGDDTRRTRGHWLDLLQPVLLLALDLMHWRAAVQGLRARQQAQQWLDALLALALACVLLGVGLISAGAALVLALDPAYRVLALGVLGAVGIGAGVLLAGALRRRALQQVAAATHIQRP